MPSALSKPPGALRGFAVAVSFALGTIVAKKRPLAMPPGTGVAWPALFGALLALFEHPDWSRLNMIGGAIFGWIAVIPLTVAYLAWCRALRYVVPSLTATTVLLSPTIGVRVSALALGDPFRPKHLVALALTGVAMAVIR